MKSKRLLVIAFAVFSIGCSVRLDPKLPREVGERYTDLLAVQNTARGMPSPIGHGTFTVFAIKIVGVNITNGPGERLVMDNIKKALTEVGYQVADAESAGQLPVVDCRVERFDFKNYTWLFPIVPTWGGIDLDLRLVDAGGQTLWQKRYSGSSWNLWFSFSSAVNSSMSKILKKMVEDFSSPAFHRACCERA